MKPTWEGEITIYIRFYVAQLASIWALTWFLENMFLKTICSFSCTREWFIDWSILTAYHSISGYLCQEVKESHSFYFLILISV